MNGPANETCRQSALEGFRTRIAGLLLVAVGISLAGQAPVAPIEAAAPPRFKAIAFDYLVLFNPDSVVPEVESVFPGKGWEFTSLWRTRQFEYSWLRSITGRYVDFFAFGGWDAAGAKAFGYPTFWVNRFNQPLEELSVRPDQTSTNLDDLLNFVLAQAHPGGAAR